MVTLADLSKTLIDQAKLKFSEFDLADSVDQFYVANAINLEFLKSNSFDAIFCNGPFYHIVDEQDRIRAANEIIRTCKSSGQILIGFIPRFSGLAGLIDRTSRNHDQINPDIFAEAARTGIFHNNEDTGFQEGFYPTVAEFKSFWQDRGLQKIKVFSTRSFMHQNEDKMIIIADQQPQLYDAILKACRSYSSSESFIEAGGHALLVGEKAS